MENTKMNLAQKLAAIRSMAQVVQKEKSGFNYKYAGIDDILAKVSAGMKKYGVSLVPSFVPETEVIEIDEWEKQKVLKNGTVIQDKNREYVFKSRVVYTWSDDETGEQLSVPWFICGSQTDPSQAIGSALTYNLRYFLTQFFQIATPEKDPDEWRSKQKEATKSVETEVAEALIAEFDTMARTYIADNPKNRDALVKFIKNYEKSGNYNKIKEPIIAQKLLEDFKNKFMKANGGETAKPSPKKKAGGAEKSTSNKGNEEKEGK